MDLERFVGLALLPQHLAKTQQGGKVLRPLGEQLIEEGGRFVELAVEMEIDGTRKR